jgi:uncharacterized sulfatase
MEDNYSRRKNLKIKFFNAAESFAGISLIWLAIIFLLSFFEIIYSSFLHGTPDHLGVVIFWSLLFDTLFWLKWLIYLYITFSFVYLFSKKVSQVAYCFFIVILAGVQVALSQYFNTALVPLGADLYGYSIADIKQTIGASGGVSIIQIAAIIVVLGLVIAGLWKLPQRLKSGRYLAIALPVLSFLIIIADVQAMMHPGNFKSDFTNNIVVNKSDHFWTETYNHFFPSNEETDIYADSYIGGYDGGKSKATEFKYVDAANYPFLHSDTAADVLTPFFKPNATPPHIVIVLVEGLGRAFTNDGAYLGNFTPFIDSLSRKSIYWKNFLSEGGRTFAALPSLLGSLPFGQHGFLDLGEGMPKHVSLLSLLKYNGYHTSFYYGGDASFDNMSMFLRKNSIDELNDMASFPAGYTKLPAASSGFSWGYNDKELFRHYFVTRNDKPASPQLSVILTVATHNPFLINEQDKYLKQFEQHMTQLGFDEAKKKEYRNYQNQYSSILYLDDALRGFFNTYRKRADFNNTIFLITGDHRMPEIPMSDKIDRYHVPLIVYSPMLKRTAQIASVSTHLDISPSLLAYLHKNYKTKGPSLVSWMGQGLDTTRIFQNLHSYPLIQTKTDILDFIMGEYHLNGNTLFKLNAELGEEPVQDEEMAGQLKNAFDQFKRKNSKVVSGGNVIMPDTIQQHYKPAGR